MLRWHIAAEPPEGIDWRMPFRRHVPDLTARVMDDVRSVMRQTSGSPSALRLDLVERQAQDPDNEASSIEALSLVVRSRDANSEVLKLLVHVGAPRLGEGNILRHGSAAV